MPTAFFMVPLPKEKLLIEADTYTPGAPNTPSPAVPNALHVNLVQKIKLLRLGVDQIRPLHGRAAPVTEIYTAIGKKMGAQMLKILERYENVIFEPLLGL